MKTRNGKKQVNEENSRLESLLNFLLFVIVAYYSYYVLSLA